MSHKPRLVFGLVLLVALLASTIGSVSAAPPARAKWTVMVYISGDNNLESYVVKDIEQELAPTGSNAEVQVVALADRIPGDDASRGDWTQTLLFHVTPGMTATTGNAVADWGERNFGDPQTLIDFVAWSKANYPADHYALFLWGHGWSWHTEFTMADDTDADTLDPHEMTAAMPALGFIDVVGYDGCNMAAIEIEAMWRNNARAIAHSEEYVGWDGIEYEKVLPQLRANPNMTADQLAAIVSQSAQGNNEKTWSAMALDARWDTLQTAVDQWAIALQAGLPANKTTYDRAFRAARSFWQDAPSKDLYDAAYQIKAKVKDANIQAKSQAVMEAVAAVTLNEWHVNAYASVHGLAIFLPTRVSELDYSGTAVNEFAYYRANLAFTANTHWDEFLAAYLGQ